jgi:hypothetical protein
MSRLGLSFFRPLKLLLPLFVAVVAGCSPEPMANGRPISGQGPEKVMVLDLEGRSVDPFEGAKDAKFLVFIFTSTDCPISNRYAPTVSRIWEDFHDKGVQFSLVYPHSDLTVDEIRKHLKDFAYPCQALRDPKHLLVKKCQAKVTPEAAVFNSKGELLYHGRIDDRYVDFGKERPDATRHELEEVLKAVLDGKAPAQKAVRPIGCYIPELP